MKNGSHAATALHGRATLHLVIPSEAEGPAVQRTFRGNVFRPERSAAERLRFALTEKRNPEASRPRHIRCGTKVQLQVRCATPDVLSRLVALASFMRLSLTESRTRGRW